MKKFTLALAALAAFALAAPVAFACDAHKAAAKTADGKTMACCTEAAKEGKTCAAHADKAVASKDAKPMACCAAKGKTAAATKDGKSCGAHAAKADAAACPMKDGAKKSEVALSGKVLCEHCNLHRKDSCSPVFQATGSAEYLPLCPEGDIASVKKAGQEGTVVLDVKGFVCENGKGEKMLMVSSFAPAAATKS